ncbi:sodium/pyruvate cotransporter BASS2, chloroplastic-like isoform X2 [Wolffia australiana]
MLLAFSLLSPSSIVLLHPNSSIPWRGKPGACRVSRSSKIRAQQRREERPAARKSTWEEVLATAASLYPLYVTVGGAVACFKPSAFSWFVDRGPGSYSCALGFIMLSMGITLDLDDFFRLLFNRPLSILFGCAAQYTIMPVFGAIIGKIMGLSPALSVGLILLACCPGGTASNVVTLIAQGDVPLSIVMTTCTTLSAVFLTPTLTKVLAGAYVPVDAVKLSLSTLQVVVAPLLLGSYMQKAIPGFVRAVTPFAPLSAVLASSLLASSVFSENIVRLRQSTATPTLGLKNFLSGDLGAVVISVILLHLAGYFVGFPFRMTGMLHQRFVGSERGSAVQFQLRWGCRTHPWAWFWRAPTSHLPWSACHAPSQP